MKDSVTTLNFIKIALPVFSYGRKTISKLQHKERFFQNEATFTRECLAKLTNIEL